MTTRDQRERAARAKEAKTYFCLKTKVWRTYFPQHVNASIEMCKDLGFDCKFCTHIFSNGCDRPATRQEITKQLRYISTWSLNCDDPKPLAFRNQDQEKLFIDIIKHLIVNEKIVLSIGLNEIIDFLKSYNDTTRNSKYVQTLNLKEKQP